MILAMITLFLVACYLCHRRGYQAGHKKGYYDAGIDSMLACRKKLETLDE